MANPDDIPDEPQLSPFLKKLASTERKEREAAVSSLRTYLSRDAEFSRLDFLKLWKGLYYCMWMCDRMRVQQQLSDTLAELVDVLQRQNAITFFDAFWSTLAKQWYTLDQHRIDKFYLLARRYVAAGFRFLKSQEWKTDVIEEYNSMLSDGPLHPSNPKIPKSIRYHITDIYIDELDKFVPLESAEQDFQEVIAELVKPFVKIQKEGVDKVAKQKATELLDDPRLQEDE